MAVEECRFLASIDLRYLPYFWNRENGEKSLLMDLLQEKKYKTALELVTRGEISPKETIPYTGTSLLKLSFRQPVLEDVAILLDAMKLRGEKIDDTDLDAACNAGSFLVVQKLLNAGAIPGPDALHSLMERAGQRKENETLKILHVLLEAKAEIDGLGSNQQVTPLVTACRGLNLPCGVLQALLHLRADVGGAGHEPPLHAYVGKWGREDGIRVLAEHRADLNQKDRIGRTALHCALSGHYRFNLAMLLKSLGADPFIADANGVRPSQLLIRCNQPEKAAELEDRRMNQEELRLKQAMEHPLAKKFESSLIQSVSWILRNSPEDGFGCISNNQLKDECDYGDCKLSDCLDGCSPKAVVLELPLTRYCEIHGNLRLTAPPEGFTVKFLLMAIYKFYQDPFGDAELSEIRQLFGKGILGDTFGYISNNVGETEGSRPKKQKVQRIELRGDCIFFEGFHECKFFEDDQTLWGRMSLGS
ncbi:unnamed protein product [Durusdinium trenchii]|uniref:Ankyrin repeat protein n=2 Tax=Durusdinium trenchii TaxID=1381693 RepID=A0ABP0M9Z2_9DINO